jgi:hypothetical protein
MLIPRQPEKDNVVQQRIIITNNHSGSYVDHYTEEMEISKLPFFYPKFKAFRYRFDNATNEKLAVISIEVLPFENLDLIDDERVNKIWIRILKHIHKFGKGFRDGYEKRVHHDLVIPKSTFQDLYYDLKMKYKHWVNDWPEDTDPSKYVYEDISIATWLILLWRSDQSTTKPFKFIDLGCGNGFLTHVLNEEGYLGYGIDLAKRKIWEKFPKSNLIERMLVPTQEVFEDVEWIIGNHPDGFYI